VCDVAETCTGNSTACPVDTFAPATTVCRAATCKGDVAVDEAFCTGTSAFCPPEVNQPCAPGAWNAGVCVTDGGMTDGGAGPVIGGAATEASCGQPYRFQPVVQGEAPFRYTLLEAPEGMTVNAETGLLEWLPSRQQAGQHAFVLRVEDARGATTDWRGTIDVSCVPKHYRVGCDCGTGLPSTDVVWTGLLLSLGLRRRRR
jgi:hypothetical protein